MTDAATAYRRAALAVGVLLVSWLLAGSAPGFETPAVKTAVAGRLAVSGDGGTGLLPVAVSRDWSRPMPGIRRAVVIVHGAHRTAARFFDTVARLVGDDETLVVAPQFLHRKDILAHKLPDNVLRWQRWTAAEAAVGPAPISSFAAVDALLLTLADRSRLPNLTEIVLAGFSAGGQLVQRYAAVGKAPDAVIHRGIALRFVVGSPSSYLYFSDDRPVAGGGFAPYTGAAACPGFDRWRYGLAGDVPRYVEPAVRDGARMVERRYAGRDVVYLLGTADNDPNHWELDKSCAAEAEGPDRYDRGVAFFHYVQSRDREILKQRLWPVPGAAHNFRSVFSSPCGRAALLGRDGCSQS